MNIRIIHNRKAGAKTLEAVIAVALMFMFVLILTPQITTRDTSERMLILGTLEQDEGFKSCVLSNQDCARDYIAGMLPAKYDFNMTMSSDPSYIFTDFPASKRVFTEAMYISGNSTNYNSTIVRLYYWTR